MQDWGINVLFKGRNMARLLEGLGMTLKISFVSIGFSLVLGVLLGLLMTMRNPLVRLLSRLYLEVIRIVPQLVLLFLMYFGLARAFDIDISGEAASIAVFTFWGTGELGDLVRGALTSLPRHQYDSAAALGLTRLQSFRYVIGPQAVRQLLPQTINLATRMIKTTSLVMLIGVVEVLKVGQQIIEAARYDTPSAALWIFGVIFILYFLICWPISRLAKRLETVWQVR